jgi:hypothetical protein
LAFEQRDTFRVRVCKASENSFLVYSYNGGARFCDIVAFAFLPNAYYNGSVVCPSVGITIKPLNGFSFDFILEYLNKISFKFDKKIQALHK